MPEDFRLKPTTQTTLIFALILIYRTRSTQSLLTFVMSKASDLIYVKVKAIVECVFVYVYSVKLQPTLLQHIANIVPSHFPSGAKRRRPTKGPVQILGECASVRNNKWCDQCIHTIRLTILPFSSNSEKAIKC